MEVFGTTPDTTYVFEDAFNGLKAGMASGATVIGLATTNSREDIAPLCHYVLDDFQGFTYDKLDVYKRQHKCSGANTGTIFGMFLVETGVIMLSSLLLVALLLFNFREPLEDMLDVSLACLFSW